MHEELSALDKLAEVAKQYGVFSPAIIAALYAMKKVYTFFTGINRLAEQVEKLAGEQKEQREKLNRMMEGPDVDARVAPVIEQVVVIRDQISQIYDHLLSPNRKRRAGDHEQDS